MNEQEAHKLDKEGWFGSTIETPTTPLVDSGIGPPLILKTFEFAIKPGQTFRPTKQQIFDNEWPRIKSLIWADGLIQNENVSPRVVIGKKRYRIFILCEPRFKHGIKVIPSGAKSLQDILKKKLTK